MRPKYEDKANFLNSKGNVLETIEYPTIPNLFLSDSLKPFDFLPIKRHRDFNELLIKRSKTLPITYEEWQPFSEALLGLNFESIEEQLTAKDIKERKDIALKMSTPEGLIELISELEGKLSHFEDLPPDAEFEKLSVAEKIERLFQDFL